VNNSIKGIRHSGTSIGQYLPFAGRLGASKQHFCLSFRSV